jgi:hypothetical protein
MRTVLGRVQRNADSRLLIGQYVGALLRLYNLQYAKFTRKVDAYSVGWSFDIKTPPDAVRA